MPYGMRFMVQEISTGKLRAIPMILSFVLSAVMTVLDVISDTKATDKRCARRREVKLPLEEDA